MTTATLYRAKPSFQRLLRPLVRRAARAGIVPDHLTVAAVGVSAVAGWLVAAAALRLVPLLYLARLALNAMDGLLAREHGMATTRGAVLNEVGDAVSDAAAYLPFALLLPGSAALVVAVVALGLVGEVAAVAGGPPRRNDGPLGKSDRAVGFGAVSVVVAAGLPLEGGVLWLMVVLAAATVLNRCRSR